MRSFTFNGTEVLVSPDWHVSDQINQRSTMQCTIVDMLSLTAIETGQEVIIYTEEKLGNAHDIGDGTFTRTSNATMQDGTIVTANVTRYETGQFGQAVMIEEGTTNQLSLPNDWTSYSQITEGTIITGDDVAYAPYIALSDKVTMGEANNFVIKVADAVLPAITGQTWTFSAKVYALAPGSIFIAITDHITWAEGWIEKINLVAGWNNIKVTITFGTTVSTDIQCLFTNFDLSYNTAAGGSGKGAASSGAITFWVLYSQLEQKAYATSWIDSGITRVAETLTIPTAGILNGTEGTVEFGFYTPTLNATSINIFDCRFVNDNNRIVIYGATNALRARVGNGTTYINTATISCQVGWNYICLRYGSFGVKFTVNTTTVTNISISKGPNTLGTEINFGSSYDGVSRATGALYDDLRISNIARSDDEILADYNSGVALPIDEHTTAKMAFNGTLEIFARPIIFGGTIDTLDDYEEDPGYLYYNIIAVDYNQLADKKLMAASYSSTLAGNIVSAIITAALSDEGITAGTIESGDTISKAVFNYIKATDALDYLKNVTGLNWNINFDKQLNFFSNASNVSPWTLTDSVPHENFKRTRTRDQYRNKQYLRAGTGKTSVQTLEKPAPAPDGVSRNFILRFPISEKPVIYVNSTAVLSANVGVNGLDTGKEWYFTYNSNTISEDGSEAVLTAGSTIEVTYSGLYPIIAVIDDPAQISARQGIEAGTSGVYESVVTEKSINENNQAIEYSEGLILKYGIIPSIVTFDTEVPGLQAGQLLPIQKPLYGINASFLIDSVQISAADSGATNYLVRCLDGSSLGGWEEWFKELLKGNREFVINENEVVILLNVQTETENWAGETTVIMTTPLYPADNLYPSETLYPGTATGSEVLND